MPASDPLGLSLSRARSLNRSLRSTMAEERRSWLHPLSPMAPWVRWVFRLHPLLWLFYLLLPVFTVGLWGNILLLLALLPVYVVAIVPPRCVGNPLHAINRQF